MIINGFILLIVIMGGVYYLLTRQTTTPTTQILTPPTNGTSDTGGIIQPPNRPTSTPPSTGSSKGDKLDIPTKGGTVTVNNFYKNPQTYIMNKDNDAMLKDDPNYQIEYFPQGNGWLISIIDGEPKEVRLIAEQKLLEILGIPKEEACEFNIMLAVSKDISQNLAGPNYGLSWCPNGLKMGSNVPW